MAPIRCCFDQTAVWHSDAARGPSTPSFDHLVGTGEYASLLKPAHIRHLVEYMHALSEWPRNRLLLGLPSRDLRRLSSLLKKVFEVSLWATLIQDPSARRTKDSQPSGFGFEYCASHVRFRVFQQTAKALSKAFRELAEADPIKYVHIMGALFPDMIRETAKDHLAEIGMTEDDLRELIQKLEACPQ